MTGGAPVGGYNTAANPAFTSVPAPTTAPGVGPFASLGTTPQTPAPYVAPQMTQVPWIPRADPATTPISSLPQATRDAIRAKLDPSLWSVVQDMKLGEAIQSFPMIRLALQAGGQPGGTGTQGGAAGGDATSGFLKIGSTWAQAFPELATNPQAQQIANQPIPASFWDASTGLFDYSKAQTAIDRQFGSPFAQSGRAATAQRERVRDLGTRITAIVNAARQAGQSGGVSQQQLHDQMQRARDLLANYRAEFPQDDISTVEALIPDSRQLFGEGAYRRQAMDLAQANFRINLAKLGLSEQQAQTAASRLGLSQQEFAFRMQEAAGNAVLGQYDAAQARGDTATMRRLQPVADQIMKDLGVAGPYAGKSHNQALRALEARIAGLWEAARVYPPKTVEAMKRWVDGKPQPGDEALLNAAPPLGMLLPAREYAQRIAALEGQRRSFQPQATPPTDPPAGYAGKTVTLDDGTKWSSDGTTWTQVP